MALTTNKNYLSPTQFQIVIERKNYPNISFFAQSVSHPSVSVAPAEVPFRRANVYMPGDKINFGQLSITALIDEDMNDYVEMFNWLTGNLEKHISPNESTDTIISSTADITINVLNSKNNKTKSIRYTSAFPVDISGIDFTSVTEEQFLSFGVTFQFDQFVLV